MLFIIFSNKINLINILHLLITIFTPIFLSYYLIDNEKSQRTKEILILHPCTQRYGSNNTNTYFQVEKYIEMIEKNITSSTDYVLLPETAMQEGLWIGDIKSNLSIQRLKNITIKNKNLKIIIGAIAYEYCKNGEILEAQYQKETKKYFKTYNAIIQIDASENIQIRTKQKLVPYEERIPYYLEWFNGVYSYLGGENWHYTYPSYKNQNLFFDDKYSNILALICYEAAFYEDFSKIINNNTLFLTCSANEIWYQNSEGAEQAIKLSQILALCTKKYIIRSSDFGISGVIDDNGEILMKINSPIPKAIKINIPIKEKMTFFVRNGSIIIEVYLILNLLIFILSLPIIGLSIKRSVT